MDLERDQLERLCGHLKQACFHLNVALANTYFEVDGKSLDRTLCEAENVKRVAEALASASVVFMDARDSLCSRGG